MALKRIHIMFVPENSIIQLDDGRIVRFYRMDRVWFPMCTDNADGQVVFVRAWDVVNIIGEFE